ncbi:hypothetical protein V2J09_021288 [Rumex salicifolius]
MPTIANTMQPDQNTEDYLHRHGVILQLLDHQTPRSIAAYLQAVAVLVSEPAAMYDQIQSAVKQQGMATEERLTHLDAALKDCISQISSLQQERERELDLKDANKKLICSLVCKQELVDSLRQEKLQLEAEFDSLLTRLDSVDKENAFLKCDCCALERQLLLTLDSADNLEDKKRSDRKIDVLVDRLCDLEEENKGLREIIKARENELCSSKVKCAQVAYRLEVMEADHGDINCMQQEVSENSLMNHFREDTENQFDSVGKQIVHADGSIKTQGCCCPWNVLDVILEEHRESKRSINKLLEEIQVSLAPQTCSETSALLDLGDFGAKPGGSDLNSSIIRIIELIEEISPCSLVGSLTIDENERPRVTNLDYSVHVLRWRNSELISVLRNFVLSCSLALNGSHGLEDFVRQLATVLEWAVDNCITLDDASRVRDRVRKHFALDRSKSEVTSQNVMTKMIKNQSYVQQENQWLKVKLRSLESGSKELETKLSLAVENNELLMKQLEESRERIERLEEEAEGVNVMVMEDQIEHQKSINEDLDTQLTVAKVNQNEMMQKVSSLEVELEERNQCCQDLETTCLELQLQLEILSRKGSPYPKQEQIGWEMISDGPRLALVVHETCKESDYRNKNKDKENRRYTLRDRMFADADGESICLTEQYHYTDANKVLAVVPVKKKGGGLVGPGLGAALVASPRHRWACFAASAGLRLSSSFGAGDFPTSVVFSGELVWSRAFGHCSAVVWIGRFAGFLGCPSPHCGAPALWSALVKTGRRGVRLASWFVPAPRRSPLVRDPLEQACSLLAIPTLCRVAGCCPGLLPFDGSFVVQTATAIASVGTVV